MQTTAVDTTPRIVFGDFEVDRVPIDDKERPCITQLCFHDPLREEGSRIFESFIAPPEHLRVKRIEKSYSHEGKGLIPQQFSGVWPDLVTWFNKPLNGDQPVVVVMHNGSKYDWPILSIEASRIQKSVPRYWKLFDTLWLAATLGIPEGERSLSALCKGYNVKPLEFHDAYNDTIMLTEVFKRMTQGTDFRQVCIAMASANPYRNVAALVRGRASVPTAVKTHQTALKVFFDFETSGLNPKADRITEAAFLIFESGESISSLINPGVPIPKTVQELTGITDEMVKDAPTAEVVLQGAMASVKRIADGRKVVWMGHNIYGFDFPFWKAAMERAGLPRPEFDHCLDTCNMSKSLFQKANHPADFPKDFKVPAKGFHTLQGHRERLGIPEDDAHRALGDCRVNAEVFRRFTEGLDPVKLDGAITSYGSGKATATLIMDEGKFSVRDYLAMLLPPSNPQPQEAAAEASPPPSTRRLQASSSYSWGGFREQQQGGGVLSLKRKDREEEEEERVFTFSAGSRKPGTASPLKRLKERNVEQPEQPEQPREEQREAPSRRWMKMDPNVIRSDTEDDLMDLVS